MLNWSGVYCRMLLFFFSYRLETDSLFPWRSPGQLRNGLTIVLFLEKRCPSVSVPARRFSIQLSGWFRCVVVFARRPKRGEPLLSLSFCKHGSCSTDRVTERRRICERCWGSGSHSTNASRSDFRGFGRASFSKSTNVYIIVSPRNILCHFRVNGAAL